MLKLKVIFLWNSYFEPLFSLIENFGSNLNIILWKLSFIFRSVAHIFVFKHFWHFSTQGILSCAPTPLPPPSHTPLSLLCIWPCFHSMKCWTRELNCFTCHKTVISLSRSWVKLIKLISPFMIVFISRKKDETGTNFWVLLSSLVSSCLILSLLVSSLLVVSF